MSSKGDLISWQEAIDAFEKKDYAGAIIKFQSITSVGARVYFNMGMIYSELGRHDDAIISFSNATFQDKYLVVGYFQKGVLEWIVGQFEDAIESFTNALNHMRQHTFIDYRQLGLNYVLFSFEVLFNRALCHLALNDTTRAICDLEDAQKNKGIREHEDSRYLASVVRDCWERGNLDEDYLPFSVPEGLLYRPSSFKVKNTEKVDFLGSSKVIASLDEEDNYVGFVGPKVRDALSEIRKKKGEPGKSPSDKENTGSPQQQQNGQLPVSSNASPKSPTKMPWKLETGLSFMKKKSSPSKGDGPIHDLDGIGSRNMSTGRNNSEAQSSAQEDPRRKKSNVSQMSSVSHGSISRISGATASSAIIPGHDRSMHIDEDTAQLYIATQDSNNNRESNASKDSTLLRTAALSSASPLTPSAQGKLRVKCDYKNEKRMIVLDQDQLTFKDLKSKLQEKFGVDKMRIRYRDEDGELVLMSDQEDLETALMFLTTAKLEISVE